MKKNLLIAVLLLLTVSSVWAKDYNVETKKFKSWGEAQFDAETATITFTKIGREADGGCPAWIARHMIVL